MSINKQVSGQGEDVVLIHGWGCDLRHMQPIANQLKDYRVTNIDLPGRGKSDWSPSINSVHDMADLLLPSLPETAVYVPWSFGGLVTLSIASRYPERVSRIIGVATSPKFIEDDGWPAVPKPGFIAGFSEITQLGFVDFFKAYYDVEFSDFNPKPKEYQELIQLLEQTPEQDLDILLKGVKICDKTDFRDSFKTLKCPVDLILGGKDSSVPSAVHPVVQSLNPAAKLHVISGAQHMSFWTHPLAFNEILMSLLP